MFCYRCGAELPDGSKFCNMCGAMQEGAPAAAAEAAPASAAPAQVNYAAEAAPVATVAPAAPEKQGKPLNKTLILIEIIGTILLAAFTVWYVLFSNEAYRMPRYAAVSTPTPTPKKATPTPTPKKATPTPAKKPTTTPKPAATATPTPTQAVRADDGTSFAMVNGILTVRDDVFGMTYEELNDYVGGTIPELISWDYSTVPMMYNGFDYTDGNSYVLFFEKNRLVGVRTESTIAKNEIPTDLYNRAVALRGGHDHYWYYQETGQVSEYDWYISIKGRKGEYAIFLNPYDDTNHICQQVTSPDYSGGTIQQH